MAIWYLSGDNDFCYRKEDYDNKRVIQARSRKTILLYGLEEKSSLHESEVMTREMTRYKMKISQPHLI